MLRKQLVVFVLVLLVLFLGACTSRTIEVTRVVEVPGDTVEVVRELPGDVVEVTRIVEVEGQSVERVVEVQVTPTPIGGELILYACLFDPDKLAVLFKAFENQTGVKVTCLDMSSGEALQRIRAEQGNPQGDVLFGTTNLSHVNLASDGLTELYKGTGWHRIPDGPGKDPDGAWTGFYYGVIGFACSPERLAEINAECPDSWEALLDPVFEGEIVIASPAASGTSYTVLSGLAELMGEDGAFEYWQRLNQNVAQYTQSGSAPGRMAAQGEYAIGIAFAHDIQVQQDHGLPVLLNFPSEGTPFEIGGISIIKGARNKAAAEAWLDFVFTEAFQRYHNDIAHRIPIVTGVDLAEGTIGLEDVKLIEGYDPTDWAAKRDDLVARWQDEIGGER
jgi:iron(III) transport system substrate-binding protein